MGPGEVAEAEHADDVAGESARRRNAPVAAVVDQRRRRRRERENDADREPTYHREDVELRGERRDADGAETKQSGGSPHARRPAHLCDMHPW